jgi:predicted nucleic acid-binding protein
MGQKYLIDTNILIYALKGAFVGNQTLVEIFNESLNISIISEIELLGFSEIPQSELKAANNLLKYANIHNLSTTIKDKSIEIRQKKKLKLGDLIIAATAITHDYTLVTRNTKDFNKVEGLKIYNPFEKD